MSDKDNSVTASTAPQKKLGWKLKIILFFFLLAGFVFLPTTIIIIIGMLPTLVTAVTDRNPAKSATVTVGSMNAAGVFPALLKLWQGSHTIPGALSVISDHTTLVVMYSAALIGVVIYNNVTPFVSVMIYRKMRQRARDIEKHLKALKEVWGDDVSQAVRKQ